MLDDDLRHRRLEIIREHMDTEVTKEFERTLATFNGHPRYEIMPTGQVFDGDEEVMGYYRMTRTAFPDQRHDNVRYHVAEDTVIQLDLNGTARAVDANSDYFVDRLEFGVWNGQMTYSDAVTTVAQPAVFVGTKMTTPF